MFEFQIKCDVCGKKLDTSEFDNKEEYTSISDMLDEESWFFHHTPENDLSSGMPVAMARKTRVVCSEECEEKLNQGLHSLCQVGGGKECKGVLYQCTRCGKLACYHHVASYSNGVGQNGNVSQVCRLCLDSEEGNRKKDRSMKIKKILKEEKEEIQDCIVSAIKRLEKYEKVLAKIAKQENGEKALAIIEKQIPIAINVEDLEEDGEGIVPVVEDILLYGDEGEGDFIEWFIACQRKNVR